MAKKSTINFVCQECGYDSPQWLGKCPECGSWNSMKEFRVTNSGMTAKNNVSTNLAQIKPQKLKEVVYQERLRIQTNYQELNNVLGGGIVRGSAMLIAGDPGVGKSTLLLQLAISLSSDKKVLYVSGEESVEQIKMRADRISENSGNQKTRKSERQKTQNLQSSDNLFLLSLTDAD